jgi:integrase
MRGNSHVRFGRRAEETDWPRGRHRASARPDHYAGTLATVTGATIREVQARLGHASPAAAYRYQHVLENRDAEIADRLDLILRGSAAVGRTSAVP